ncbi:MAG: hypothetical protein AB3N23_08025 [Paracoccaceae bacterium]
MPQDMSGGPHHHRGAAPVGYMHELDPIEAGAVQYLRLWCSGPEHKLQIWDELMAALGPCDGRSTYETFESMCSLFTRYARRPMMRHHVSCKCLGADESCFANFVGYASEGAREDAFLLAVNLVRPDVAASLVSMGEAFGMALRRAVAKTNLAEPRPAATVH